MTTEPTGWGYQEIGWLLEQVREAGGAIPARYYPADGSPDALNGARKARLGFGQAISGAFSWHRIHRDLTSDAPWKRRVRSLAALGGQVSRIQGALDGDTVLRRKLSGAIGRDNGIGLHEILQGLERLGKAAKDLAAGLDETAPLRDFGMTAQELLFDQLANAYREGMDADPAQGTIKTYNAPGGAFVAFVRAAFSLAGKSRPTDTALYKALQRTGIIGLPDDD